MPSLNDAGRYMCLIAILGTGALGYLAFNPPPAKSAILYFEELPPDLITLGLVAVRPSISKINMDNSHERRDLL